MNPQTTDSLRAVLDSVFAAPTYHWVRHPDPFAPLVRAWTELLAWLQQAHNAHPLAYRLFLAGCAMVLLAIVAHSAWALIRTVGAEPHQPAPDALAGDHRDERWYRRDAERLAAEGRFAEAIQADFVALLLALDARRAVHFEASRTPAEYLRDAKLGTESRQEFADLVTRLYGYAFARLPCGPPEYAEWRARAIPDRYAPAH
ncbi:MAG: hypothetical protein ACREK8_06055 [Gemmatimonadales bacterium]